MVKDTNRNQRRTVLKTIGGGVAGLSFLGTSIMAGAEATHNEIDTNFNPGQENELIEFFKKFNELNEEGRDDIWDELNHGQRMAYHDANRLTSADMTDVIFPNSASAQSFPYDYTATFQFDLYGLGGFGGVKVFELYHQIMWDVEGDEVVAVETNGWTENRGWFWGDDGNSKSVLEERDGFWGHTVDSTRERKMTYASSPWNTFTEYPETTISGASDGIGRVTECDGDGLDIENVDHPLVC
ncbi:hypothetical protein [Halovivax gelatinilyticus]|uniref:hypothetical protein n=1 Tax=Halovivax gelatinilyticus TaxID=2961597 RepID=UPI0020CA37A8|nr:hypothetical protein [Halovivax gelatinilyticus]